MSAVRPVARLVAPVVGRVASLGFLLATIAVAGVGVATTQVHHLAGELQPAAAAQQDVLQDLSDMQGAVRAYAQSGQRVFLDDYRDALTRLPGDQRQVARFAAGDRELADLVARQDAAAAAWLDEYAEVRVDRRGGPRTFEPSLFHTGVARFADFRRAHDATSAAFDARVRDAGDAAERWLEGTILAVALLTAAGAWVVARARRRLLSEIADPLRILEHAVHRMATTDPDSRAVETGPREVRALASALNELADAQAQGRAVEARIQDELRALDTAKDDFVSNVSHELRTPLTTISGYLELVAEEFEGRMAPRHHKMMEASRRNVSRLRLLIDDLLTLSRAESRHTDLEQVDLVAVVRDVVTDVRMTAARRRVRVESGLPDGPLLVLGDRVMLHRALLNVVGNAVKFSHDDGVVEIAVAAPGRRPSVVVRDHGIGIPASELDRLGTRFFRASNAVTNEIAGTGLGVRIVQTIVDKHAGDLAIHSEEGVGTTVTIRLPGQGDASDGRVAAPGASLASAAQVASRPVRAPR